MTGQHATCAPAGQGLGSGSFGAEDDMGCLLGRAHRPGIHKMHGFARGAPTFQVQFPSQLSLGCLRLHFLW